LPTAPDSQTVVRHFYPLQKLKTPHIIHAPHVCWLAADKESNFQPNAGLASVVVVKVTIELCEFPRHNKHHFAIIDVQSSIVAEPSTHLQELKLLVITSLLYFPITTRSVRDWWLACASSSASVLAAILLLLLLEETVIACEKHLQLKTT
jgi:hypothetical protein